MQLLVIGAKNQVGRALSLLAEQEGIACSALETDDEGYLSVEAIQAHLKDFPADYLINTSLYPDYLHAESHANAVVKVNHEMLEALAKLSESESIPLIQLSDAYVFDGSKEGMYDESDEFKPLGIYGQALLKGEEAIQSHCPRHIILRAGAVFSQWGDNYLTRILEEAKGDDPLIVPQGLKGCPTPAADVARVVIAMLRQIDCGSNTWGTFHYCSSDATSSYDFVDAVLSVLSQHVGSIERDIQSIPREDDSKVALHPINSVMCCRKILDTFGIKQRPWRSGLTAIVKDVYPDMPHVS